MPEKQEKAKPVRKSGEKSSKEKTKPLNRSTGKAKPRRRRKKQKNRIGVLIAVLSLICILLLGLNLFLVLNLVPGLKRALQAQQMQPAAVDTLPLQEPPAQLPETSPAPAVSPGREEQAAHQKNPADSIRVTDMKKTSGSSAVPSPRAEETGKKASPSGKKQPVKPKVLPQAPAVKEKEKTTPPSKKLSPPLAKPQQPQKQPVHAGTLMFVFDDAGHNLTHLDYFLKLPFPCTIAVLPQLRYSAESARRIRKAGKQVILHQPMQSIDPNIDPGPGAILPGLSEEHIKHIVKQNLEQIWPVDGMNNHEGSLITQDTAAMRAVLDIAAEKNIFFLDSRTTAQSVVPQVAKEKNMVIWERAVFIDNKKDRRSMETQIKKGMAIARRTGSAILIGHVVTTELAELLTDMYPLLIEEGFTFSRIAASVKAKE
ncbi:MAG: divergent polysaccharide deacetylase family protein [Treponema sp.]